MNEAEVRSHGNVISLAAINGRKLKGENDITGYENAKVAGELYPKVMKSIARLWLEKLSPAQVVVLLNLVERSLGTGALHVHITQQEMLDGEVDEKGSGEYIIAPIKMGRDTLIRILSSLSDEQVIQIHSKVMNVENGKIANVYVVDAEKLIEGPYDYIEE